MKPAYLINRFDIVDRRQFATYIAAVMPIIAAHKGEVLVGNESARKLEGNTPKMTVVIRFASEEQAMGFYDSPEYVPVKPIREQATKNHSCILVAGDVMDVSQLT